MAIEDSNVSTNGYEANVPFFNPDVLAGQSFTASDSYELGSIEFRLQKDSGSPGVLTISLYATDGSGLPTGGVLSTGTTNGDTLPTSGYETRETSMSSYNIVSGTKYCILIDQASAVNGNGWGALGSSVNPYAGGCLVNNNVGGVFANYTNFDLWFRTNSPDAAPGKATNPSPTNTATGVSINVAELSWTQGDGADTEEVYFGPSGDLSLVQDGAGTTFDLSGYLPFPYGTTYQWRIDSTNDVGTTTGDTWSFTTMEFTPPEVSVFQTVKRLCACAENRFWYESI